MPRADKTPFWYEAEDHRVICPDCLESMTEPPPNLDAFTPQPDERCDECIETLSEKKS